MRRSVTTVSSGPRRSAAMPLLIALAIVGALVAVAIFALSGSGPQVAARPDPPKVELLPDRRTAASAAIRFANELAVVGVRRPSVYGRRLRAIAAPGAERRVRSIFGTGAEQVRSLVSGSAGLLRAAPMGYRIDDFDARSADVTVWMVAIAGGSRLEPTAQWRVLTLELAWTRTGWRVAGGSGANGPSPQSALPLLVAEASTFKELRHVP
jgi:hypothetical protein